MRLGKVDEEDVEKDDQGWLLGEKTDEALKRICPKSSQNRLLGALGVHLPLLQTIISNKILCKIWAWQHCKFDGTDEKIGVLC